MADRPVVIVSNRGPLSFRREADGSLLGRRGAGGLVSGVAPLVAGTDTVWVAAALSDADRDAAASGAIEAEGLRVRLVAPDPDDLALAYDVVSNQTLWYVHHGMLDRYREPTFDAPWFEAWEAYRRVNAAFADAVAEIAPRGAAVLVQDYHLALLAPALAAARPDVELVHITHTPFAHPEELAVLPAEVRRALLTGLAAHRACGFHTERWAANARACAAADGLELTTFVAPLGPDPDDLARTATSDAGAAAHAAIDEAVGDQRFVVRVDRVELSKNIVRGFLAYDHLLATRPEWRGRVTFGAYVYPSREGVPAYRRYRERIDEVVASIDERWATDDWSPIRYEPRDDYPRSIAALRRADVVLVNPVRDGLNLVAKEAPLLNDRDAVLVLSPGAGAFDELAGPAVAIDPYDVVAGAAALERALAMEPAERGARADELRTLARRHSPATWLDAQLTAI